MIGHRRLVSRFSTIRLMIYRLALVDGFAYTNPSADGFSPAIIGHQRTFDCSLTRRYNFIRTMMSVRNFLTIALLSATIDAFSVPPSSSKQSSALYVLQEPRNTNNGVRVDSTEFTDAMLEDMSRQMKDMNEQMEEWSSMYPREPPKQSSSYVFAGKKDYKVQPWYNAPEEAAAMEDLSTPSMEDLSAPIEEETEAHEIVEAVVEPETFVEEESAVIEAEAFLNERALTEENTEVPIGAPETEEPQIVTEHHEEVFFQQDIPLNDEFVTGKKFKAEIGQAIHRSTVDDIPADIITPPSWNTGEQTRATNLRLAERLKDAHTTIQELTAENAELKAIQTQHDAKIAEIQAKLAEQDKSFVKERQAAKEELEAARKEGKQALVAAKEEAAEILTQTTKDLQTKLDAAESLVSRLEATMQKANKIYIEEEPESSPSVVPQDDYSPTTVMEISPNEHAGVRQSIRKRLGAVKGAIGGVLPFKRGKSMEILAEGTEIQHEKSAEDDNKEEPKLEA